MFKHAEKLEIFLKDKSKMFKWYNFKYPQMAYQGLFIIIIGSIAYGKPGSCSVPVNVFLKGLFAMYICAFVLNFLVFLVRICKEKSLGTGYSRTMKTLTLRIDLCYFPVYWGFSILEFCWYVIGAEWISEDNDCMDEYPDGIRLSQALVALWIIALVLVFGIFISLNCYLYCHKYSGNQSLGPEIIINCPINDVRSHPQSPQKADYTVSHTPAREFGD